METIKPKRGRTKVPENQRKKLMSAYLTDEEKKLILAKYESLTNAVRTEILPKLLQKPKDGHRHTYWD